MSKKIDKKLWGVLGKQQTYYSPQQFLQGKTKVPLNANPFDSWDMKRSRFYRVDGYENAVQQGGTVIGQQTPAVTSSSLPVTATPTPSITPTQTNTPSITPSTTPIVDCYWNSNDTNWNDDSTLWNDCINVPSPTPSPTQTITPSVSPTNTLTPTPSVSPTNTLTPTPSATPPAFSPSGLTNLQFWFMADSGFTASDWTNYGLMGSSISQSTAANQPSATTITMGSWTGTGIQFLSRDYMRNITYSGTNFSAFTWFWVARKVAGGTPDQHATYLYSGATDNVKIYSNKGMAISDSNAGTVFSDNFGYRFSAEVPTNWFITISGTTTKADSYANNSLLTTTGITYTNGDGVNSIIMGNDPGSSSASDVRIVEVIIYNQVLNSTDYNKVKDYIETKYNYSSW